MRPWLCNQRRFFYFNTIENFIIAFVVKMHYTLAKWSKNMSDDILDMGESFQYQMCDGNNPVGMCYISIHDNKTSPRGEGQIYPDSWFVDENSDKLKPMLEIDGFGMYAGDNEGKGYGRFGLQMAYEKSVEHGCGGRIAVQATYSGPSFYEHCGFTGKDKGSEGLKLFNPTEENIATLYKKTRPESFNFQQDNYGIELNGQEFSLDEAVQEEQQIEVSIPLNNTNMQIIGRLQERLKEKNEDSETTEISEKYKMVTFSDIINFQYGETEVDKDICHLLQTDKFKPAYADITREFLAPEIANCQQAVNDENHLLTVREQNTMSEDNLTRDEKELSEALGWLDFSSDKREFWHNYFTNPPHGRQKAPPLCVLQNNNKKYITMPFGMTKDAFYTTYTEIHELMHGVQAKYFNPEETKGFHKDHYELLYQGKSRDEALTIQTANNPELVKQRHYERCFKEMQANSAATCYMMLQACRTGDKSIIDKVEQRLLNESAAMSGALMNENLGLAYFEYPATKKIIEDVKSGKCDNLLNDKGLLDWKALYNYTKTKVDEMGYSKDDMYESLQTAKLLKGLRAKHPDNKDVFLQEVEKLAPTLKAPHNKIFNHFAEAQRVFKPERSGMLNFFYFRLANKDTRDELLAKFDNQSIPNIEKYRQIHQDKKNTGIMNIVQSLKRVR